MASPLADFANARILWCAPGTRGTALEGYKMQPGQAYLIQAFLKRRSTPALLADRLELASIDALPAQFSGYAISYAPLAEADVPTFETVDLSTLTWVESGLLPPQVRRDSEAKLYLPGLDKLDVKFKDKTSVFGHEGIGGIIRGVLGDQIFLEGGQI